MNITSYEKELRYFQEAAQRFADAYPEQARQLNLRELSDKDPYVERLIEAFAFLSGGINQRIEDEFSEFAVELIQSIYPHYLLSLPSSVILEMKIESTSKDKKYQSIEKGAIVESGKGLVSTNNPCRFTTCATVHILPIVLENVEIKLERPKNKLSLEFKLFNTGISEGVWNNPIRFYIHGDSGIVYNLYYLLREGIEFIQVILKYKDDKEENDKEEKYSIPLDHLKPAAAVSQADFPLLDYPERSFPGFRLLEEYFFFPEKFRFFDLNLFSEIKKIPEGESTMTVDFILRDSAIWGDIKLGADNLKLNCTPAINLFKVFAEPIVVDDSQPLYRVAVDHAYTGHYIPHHIDSVEREATSDNPQKKYHSFYSFRHMEKKEPYYHIKYQTSPEGNLEFLLGVARSSEASKERLYIDLMCTNDRVVRELSVGDIDKPYKGFPSSITVKNLTRPTEPLQPDLKSQNIWFLINSLALNYHSLQSKEQIQSMLNLYDRKHIEANRKRINAVVSLETKPFEIFLKGCLTRGLSIDITLNENGFSNRGDLLMFSDVLSRVLTMFVPVNAFWKFQFIEEESRRSHYQWPANEEMYGDQRLL
ncbi:MAG: type VI secretion system baseplate subunit TssF [Desulfamplus sp.]|nr:type VI secretion system baseplate subunit TssF [Desulfamplus sp.]